MNQHYKSRMIDAIHRPHDDVGSQLAFLKDVSDFEIGVMILDMNLKKAR